MNYSQSPLTQQAEERTTTLRKTEETLQQANETIRSKDQQNKEKDESIRSKDQIINEKETSIKQKDGLITKQAATIAEQGTKLGEFVAMEKRLNDKLNTTHSKVVAVEVQMTETAKDVKWIRGIVHPENAITVWNPSHYRKEGRRITSIGVMESSKLEESKTGYLAGMSWSSVFRLNGDDVYQNGTKIASGNQKPKDNSVVTIELDMNRHTLVLFVDGQRQPHSLAKIPPKVRFALFICNTDRYAEILSFDDVSAQK
ncbi:hypothetical protein BLNAU_6206 [Blattamonas nauphoetae]|uniref:Uncharacterized protein n=1 Tax=Blattamonas nauphoetae TaxID=2049346 RepID=A0ABQ9Y4S7_9EUKA|nr:hypothetical protein BLNAU_6206 [Blattamonas nauphoetae]